MQLKNINTMEGEFDIIYFTGVPDDECVDDGELNKFIEDAEIVLFNSDSACAKSFIKRITSSFRGAKVEFNNGQFDWGYRVVAKLVKSKSNGLLS